jgi:hypothetical protein
MEKNNKKSHDKTESKKINFNLFYLLYFLSVIVLILNWHYFGNTLMIIVLSCIVAFSVFIKNADIKKIIIFTASFCSFPVFLTLFLMFLLPSIIIISYLFEDLSFLHKFVFSLPISLLFLVLVQALGYLGISFSIFTLIISYSTSFLILFIIKKKKFPINIFSTENTSIFVIFLIILVANSFYTHDIFINDKVALSQGTSYFVDSYYIAEQMDTSKLIYWDHFRDLGKPLITLDPSAYYLLNGATMHFFKSQYILVYNAIFEFLILFTVFAIFLLFFVIFDDLLISLFSSLTIIILPSFTNLLNMGATKLAFEIPFLFLCLLALTIAQKNNKYYFLFFIALMGGIYAHLGSGLLIPVFISILYVLCIKVIELMKTKKNPITKQEFKIFFLLIFLFLFCVAFYLFPSFIYSKYTAAYSKPLLISNIIANIPNYFKIILFSFNSEWYPLVFSFLIKTLIIGGIAFCIFNISKNKFAFAFGVSYFLSNFILQLLIFIKPIAQIEIPAKYQIISFSFVLPLIFLSFLFLKSFMKNKKIYIILATLFFLSLVIFCYSAQKNGINSYLGETLLSGNNFKQEMAVLKNIPDNGRIAQFGIFPIAIHPAIYYYTGKPAAFGNFYVISNRYELGNNLMDLATRTPKYTNREYNDNMLKLLGIEYAWFFVCSSPGQVSINSFNYTNFKLIYTDNQCSYIFKIPNSTLADIVSPISYLSYLNNTNHQDYISSKEYEFNLNYPEFNSYSANLNKISESKYEIKGPFKQNQWIHFKENYYPSVHAYDENGKNLEIIQANTGFILVKPGNANIINIIFSPTSLEIICVILTIIGIFGSFIFIVLFKL